MAGPVMAHADLPPEVNAITGTVVDEAIHVHRSLGPGLYEWVYRDCLAHRLVGRGFRAEREVSFPARFEEMELPNAFRVDLDVDGTVLVELKAVPELLPSHYAQIRTYLRTSGRLVGLLVNFHQPRLVDGLYRVLNRMALTTRGPGEAEAEHPGP